MTKPVLFLILALLTGCNNQPDPTEHIVGLIGTPPASVPATDSTEENGDLDTLYKDNNFIVLGDAKQRGGDVAYIATKFKPFIRYSDFKVNSLYNKPGAPLNFTSNPPAKHFLTVIKEKYAAQQLNFAGHYCFIYWGCGNPCKQSVLVDLITGKIYDGPTGSLGYSFQKDSRMLLLNEPDSTGYYLSPVYMHPEVYIWDEANKTFEDRNWDW